MLRLLTRHSAGFNPCSTLSDLNRSIYVGAVARYVEKVSAFYKELGITAAIWSTGDDDPLHVVERDKEVEYQFEVDPDRVVAYVDTHSWNEYLQGKRQDFEYSRAPASFESVTYLVYAPLRETDLLEKRTYRRLGSPDKYEIVDVLKYK